MLDRSADFHGLHEAGGLENLQRASAQLGVAASLCQHALAIRLRRRFGKVEQLLEQLPIFSVVCMQLSPGWREIEKECLRGRGPRFIHAW